MKLEIINLLISKIHVTLAYLLKKQKLIIEERIAKKKSMPLVSLKRIPIQMGHSIPFCTVIEANREGTLGDMLVSAGFRIPMPEVDFSSYTIYDGEESIERRIMQWLLTGGFLLSEVQAKIINEKHPFPIRAVITEYGVVHRAGNVFISGFTEVTAYKGGSTNRKPPTRKTPVTVSGGKTFSPTLFSSIWGPGTRIYMCIPDNSS